VGEANVPLRPVRFWEDRPQNDRFPIGSSHEGQEQSLTAHQLRRRPSERKNPVKNEYAKIRAIGAIANSLVVLNVFYLVTDDDFDPSISLVIFIARVTFIFAVFFIWSGRLRRRVAFLFPAPSGDRPLLLSKLSGVLGEYGYHALDTAAVARWEFGAQPIIPAGKAVNKASAPRTVSIEVAGPVRLRVEGSSALMRQMRKQFPGAVRVPYVGPQPWISRGRTALALSAAVVVVFGACISYIAPVILSTQLARHDHPAAVATERAGQHSANSSGRSGR
jgi:hypothetical protein